MVRSEHQRWDVHVPCRSSLAFVVLISLTLTGVSNAGRRLYNNIRLPDAWPPQITELTLDPITPPYLDSRPEVIPIDIGRQLFVDNFLIQQTTLTRTYHKAQYYPGNPIVMPDRSWERVGTDKWGNPAPSAMVYSDGVWYDPKDGLFKMWYMGGYVSSTCYATSTDGIHWSKPSLDVVEGTNIVLPERRDSETVWLDLEERNPSRRYKMFRFTKSPRRGLALHFSPDGVHWGDPVVWAGPTGDRTTAFYNPFRKVWVYSLRGWGDLEGEERRFRRYREHRDVVAGAQWSSMDDPPLWTCADRLDPPRADLNVQPQLYNLDAVPYESLMLGLFTIWRGQPEDRAKPNEVTVAFSRDGFYWHRPVREAFIPVSENQGDWNWANVQSAGGGCLVVGDQLYFYVSARAGVPGSKSSGECTTGLAVLRRDGFASMDADPGGGTLTTRAVLFRGKHLFVNADVDTGELKVEVLDESGKVIAPFSLDNCIPVGADKTKQPVRWAGVKDLSALAGRAVKFRFHLTDGRLYSFWVSPEHTGQSHGYVAAGGPGFAGPTDGWAYPAPAKSTTPFGTLGGSSSEANGANIQDQVVGESLDAHGFRCPFAWEDEVMTKLPLPAGHTQGEAREINSTGQVVGWSRSGDDRTTSRAVLWEKNGRGKWQVTDISGDVRSTTRAINGSGQVVGMAYVDWSTYHAHLWERNAGGGWVASDLHSGAGHSWAFDINDIGEVVGEWNNRPALWQRSSADTWEMTGLGTLGGSTGSARAINDAGQIVGQAETDGGEIHAFLWTEQEGMEDLGTLGGTASCALDINSLGQVVGWSELAGDAITHAFIYDPIAAVMVDLNNLLPESCDWELIEATGINDAGHVVGYGNIEGEYRGFLITFVPEPATMALLAFGCGLCFPVRRRGQLGRAR